VNPAKLQPLLAPRTIAIVGASESPDSWAPDIYHSLLHIGYSGELYPVNPKYEEVWGRPCRSSVLELPKGVDLAVIVVPARVAVRMVDDCGKAGVRGALVVSSGFGEAGEEGRELQAQLCEIAGRHRLPVLGPNVEGYVNYVDRVAPYGTTPPPEPVAGGISVISQSGTVAWAMNQMASDRGVGLRIILGVGNEAVIGLGDMLEWAAADPHTEVVTTYFETLRDVEGMRRGLDALHGAGKPILVCAPAGRSEAARRSIVAHTGALAGDTVLRDGWLKSHGAILVEDPVTMFEAAVLFSFHRKLRIEGVAAALQSGGACTLFAEAADASGLNLPGFAAATERKLAKALPHYASQNNPLDVTGQAAVEIDMYCEALEAIAGDPAIGFVAVDAFPPRLEDEGAWAEPMLQKARELEERTGVVFASVVMSPTSYNRISKDFIDRQGLAFLQGHRAAAGAIRALIELQGVDARTVVDLPPHESRAKAVRSLRGLAGPLDEAGAAKLLELYGVRRPREATVRSSEQAREAARRLGFPVAVKALAPEIPHKARLGCVRLSLSDPTAVEVAAGEVLRNARRAGATAPKLLVQRMASGVEVLVGAIVDEHLGALVTMRPGGALAERGEATFVLAPLTRKQASTYVREQATCCGLDPEVHDLGAVSRAVERIARAAHDLRGRLVSLEANPLIVGQRGSTAVDALAEVRPPA
jgi:acyl-CoA synthetase (NDP forming)